MKETFTRDITFLSNVFDAEANKWDLKPVTKPVSFYELSQTEPNQHKLFFLMKPLYEQIKTVGGDIRLIGNPKVVHELTVEAINTLMIVDDEHTPLENRRISEAEKTEFLNDGFALLEFGSWFFESKYTAFFLTFLNNYQGLQKTTPKQ